MSGLYVTYYTIGRDRMLIAYTFTYAISCAIDSHICRGVLDAMLCDSLQIFGFLWILRFFCSNKTYNLNKGLGLWCLTPFSIIFHLYRGGQFYW